jgi:hypothetical protein
LDAEIERAVRIEGQFVAVADHTVVDRIAVTSWLFKADRLKLVSREQCDGHSSRVNPDNHKRKHLTAIVSASEVIERAASSCPLNPSSRIGADLGVFTARLANAAR